MARAAASAAGTRPARDGAARAGPTGTRPSAEVLGAAGPPRAADRPDRWFGRGGPGGGARGLVLLPGLQAEPLGHAAGLFRPVRGAELADRRGGQPAGAFSAADRHPAWRRRHGDREP